MSMYQTDAELRDTNNYWNGYQHGESDGQKKEWEEAAKVLEAVVRAFCRKEDLEHPAMTQALAYLRREGEWEVNV